MKQWRTPEGLALTLCLDILQQPHTLIAGTTGSGKSTLIDTLIYAALSKSPSHCQLILIDPKRVSLSKYKNLPHTLAYASEPEDIRKYIHAAAVYMEDRYKIMQERGQEQSTEPHAYLIIDELSPILKYDSGAILTDLQRITMLGRAANIHLIGATQSPNRKTLSAEFAADCVARVGLRCLDTIESRQIIRIPDAVRLPMRGWCYYHTPQLAAPEIHKIPRTDPTELAARIKWWEDQKPTTPD